jgi:hypothetical protein
MTECLHCGQSFEPEKLPDSPEVQVGVILARERFHDEGRVCGGCLASRGCLAMMYDCEFRR